ncbi:RDD family protein [Streptomyces sp. NPDC051940]|uniref:RDD family protein n=1 Tax=Streptomyces sp. NPDC051940 TaxID=3155675 RepID=UPI003438603B
MRPMSGDRRVGDGLAPLLVEEGPAAYDPSVPGMFRRAVAVLVDLVLAGAALIGPVLLVDDFVTDPGTMRLTALLWILCLVLVYAPLSNARWGATPGKRLLRLRVVRDADGGRLGYGSALVRHVVNMATGLVPFLAIASGSFVPVGGRTLADRAAGSRVVRARRDG